MKFFFLMLHTFLSVVAIAQTNKEVLVSKPVKNVVNQIVQYKTVQDERIGFAAAKSKVYQAFEKLSKIASNRELVQLTEHPTPNVRVYAFWALATKYYKAIKEVLEKRIKDVAMVEYQSGCITSNIQVNQFYLDILTPQQVDLYCIKLSKEEVEKYKKKIDAYKK